MYHCRYVFVTLWKNLGKNIRRYVEMLLWMEKFNVQAKNSYISIFAQHVTS